MDPTLQSDDGVEKCPKLFIIFFKNSFEKKYLYAKNSYQVFIN